MSIPSREDELRVRLLEIRAKLLDSDVDPDLLGPPLDAPNRAEGIRLATRASLNRLADGCNQEDAVQFAPGSG